MAAHKKRSSINLISGDDFASTKTKKFLNWALTSFRTIVIFVEIIVVLGFAARFWIDARNSSLDEEIVQREALIRSYADTEKQFRDAQSKISIFNDYTLASHQVLPLLEPVTSTLPSDVRLVTFTKTGPEITIIGESLSEQSILQFIANLQANADLPSTTLVSAESKSDSPFIVFTLKAETRGIGGNST